MALKARERRRASRTSTRASAYAPMRGSKYTETRVTRGGQTSVRKSGRRGVKTMNIRGRNGGRYRATIDLRTGREKKKVYLGSSKA